MMAAGKRAKTGRRAQGRKRPGTLILVSNRLPASLEAGPDGPIVKPSAGGLVTALRPVLKARKGFWIGWAGKGSESEIEKLVREAGAELGCQMIPVSLNAAERQGFYAGFSNEIVWPLFHDLQSRCNFDPTYWKAYVTVNRKFAEAVAHVTKPDSMVWVHDYHLMLCGEFLRQQGLRSRVGFFLHIPFPPLDIFEKLPWRSQILRALFQYDVVGFQTPRDLRNFLGCVRRLLPDLDFHRTDEEVRATVGGHRTVLKSFPIGIDFDEFSGQAQRAEVVARAEQIRKDMRGVQIVLGVDRLDYTKGVPERLRAVRHLLESRRGMRQKISLVQIVVPSREEIPMYQELKLEIETLVSQINGQFGDPGWTPVHYMHRSVERTELLALYRAADIALITPLKDGMNLVAKEFCAAQTGAPGVLVLSEFAGAAEQLQNGAILVNPYDFGSVAEAVQKAFHMPMAERAKRMRKLRRKLQYADVFRWCEEFWEFLEG
jgi:alpha,alpha-trehalose-phosphate synthase [UDP-forming]